MNAMLWVWPQWPLHREWFDYFLTAAKAWAVATFVVFVTWRIFSKERLARGAFEKFLEWLHAADKTLVRYGSCLVGTRYAPRTRRTIFVAMLRQEMHVPKLRLQTMSTGAIGLTAPLPCP